MVKHPGEQHATPERAHPSLPPRCLAPSSSARTSNTSSPSASANLERHRQPKPGQSGRTHSTRWVPAHSQSMRPRSAGRRITSTRSFARPRSLRLSFRIRNAERLAHEGATSCSRNTLSLGVAMR